MGDMAESFHLLRAERVRRNAEALIQFQSDIIAMRDGGFEVKELTPYHFRVNGTIDLFPISRRYHNIKKNTRGHYEKPFDILSTL
jgi:hypothetical protein